MKYPSNFTFFTLIIILLNGCITDITETIPEATPLPVIIGILDPEHSISVAITRTAPVYEKVTNVSIQTSKVELWRNDTFAVLLRKDSSNYYVTDIKPKTGEKWTIKAYTEYGLVTATTIIPSKVRPSEGRFYPKPNSIKEEYSTHNTNYEFSVTIPDPQNEENAYWLLIHEPKPDSIYSRNYFKLYSNDAVIIADERFRFEENFTQDIERSNYMFSDKLFSGQARTLLFGADLNTYLPGQPETVQPFSVVRLRTCHIDLYRFYKNYRLPTMQIGDLVGNATLPLFTGDPVPPYNNINGGLGLWTSYNTDTLLIPKTLN